VPEAPDLEEQIQAACATADPRLCNLRVTIGHYDLSLALRDALGADTGANFHTWAVWGSKKAGTTIRHDDFSGVRGVLLRTVARPALNRASREILAGNITVLDDIGQVTERFVREFPPGAGRDDGRLEGFLAQLRPGPPSVEGQDLLARAFRHYWLARHESDPNTKHEHVLLANLQAILHEHVRLEPHIAGSIPRPLRAMVTARVLDFRAGAEELQVGQDLTPASIEDAPESLRHITNADLSHFLTGPVGWDRTPDDLAGSGARDWTDIRDRMNYIVDLFRSRHFDSSLFDSPYDEGQREAIEAGRLPPGPL
jgi:hypothetical protein